MTELPPGVRDIVQVMLMEEGGIQFGISNSPMTVERRLYLSGLMFNAAQACMRIPVAPSSGIALASGPIPGVRNG